MQNEAPNGLRVRIPHSSDARTILALGRLLLQETDHFLRMPEERARDVEEMQAIMSHYGRHPGSAMVHVWDGEQVVAEGVLASGGLARTAHVGNLGIGVLKAYWGQGAGQMLMTHLEDLAQDAGLQRLELTVLAHNHRARDFYTKLGYDEEGVKRASVRYDAARADRSQYADEVMMAKWIGPAP